MTREPLTSARLEEGVDEAAVALSGRVEERARAELVGGVHVGAGLEEGVDDAAVAVEGGEDEGVAAVVHVAFTSAPARISELVTSGRPFCALRCSALDLRAWCRRRPRRPRR